MAGSGKKIFQLLVKEAPLPMGAIDHFLPTTPAFNLCP